MDNVEEAAALYVMIEEWDMFRYQARAHCDVIVPRPAYPLTCDAAN